MILTVRRALTVLVGVLAIMALAAPARAVAPAGAMSGGSKPHVNASPTIAVPVEQIVPNDALQQARVERTAASQVQPTVSFQNRPVTVAPAPIAPSAPRAGGGSPAAPAPQQPAAPPANGCGYSDVPTSRSGYGSWNTVVVDTNLMLPGGYYPGDMVDSSAAGINGGYALRSLVINDLAAMAADARAGGVIINIDSGFRSYAQQQATFNYYVGILGYNAALLRAARPGHSEHQLGTTIDLADTPGGYAWVAANGWKYGWVQSYPAGATALSCYQYEPWHYRYVGRDLAAAMHGQVPRIYLLNNFGS